MLFSYFLWKVMCYVTFAILFLNWLKLAFFLGLADVFFSDFFAFNNLAYITYTIISF